MRQILLVISLVFSTVVYAQQHVMIACHDCGQVIKVSISVDGTETAVHEDTSVVATSGQCKATTVKGVQCSCKA